MRYERPNDRNRWERPLFVIRPEDEALPLEDIHAAINGQQLNPNLATVQQPVCIASLVPALCVFWDSALRDLVTTQHSWTCSLAEREGERERGRETERQREGGGGKKKMPRQRGM